MLKISLSFWFKWAIALGVLLAIAYSAACAFLVLRQNRFIFFPSRSLSTTPADLQINFHPEGGESHSQKPVVEGLCGNLSEPTSGPRQCGIPFSSVWLPVSVGDNKVEHIHGWWIPASSSLKSHFTSSQNRVLLYLHGNAGNISSNVNHAYRFHQLGFSVLLIDYRGYGLSEGDFPTESTVYQDAETAWKYLLSDRGVPPEQIFIYGHSLGGAIAIELAIRHPEAAGLIVQGSFTSLRDMINHRRWYFRIFPIDVLLTHRFDSINKVPNLKMPVLFIHGTEDEAVPFNMTHLLFHAAPEPKQLFIVPGAGHNNVAAISGERYFQTIRQFIQLVKSGSSVLR